MARISAAAERKRAEVRELCRPSGKTVPDWWDSAWENALCLAETLGRLLGTIDGWKWSVPEWNLDAQAIAVGQGRNLILRGRADLLLAKTDDAAYFPRGVRKLWIIDFRQTGNKRSLDSEEPRKERRSARAARPQKSVVKGEATQLALYALAAKQLGAGQVDLSILSPAIVKPEAQLHDDDFADCANAFAELARMQETGSLRAEGGARCAARSLSPKTTTLATLSIGPEIIDDQLGTHPSGSGRRRGELVMTEPRDQAARERFAQTLDRNFSVIASAGSGKTRAVTDRIAAARTSTGEAFRQRCHVSSFSLSPTAPRTKCSSARANKSFLHNRSPKFWRRSIAPGSEPFTLFASSC